jgi:hypothetical protein
MNILRLVSLTNTSLLSPKKFKKLTKVFLQVGLSFKLLTKASKQVGQNVEKLPNLLVEVREFFKKSPDFYSFFDFHFYQNRTKTYLYIPIINRKSLKNIKNMSEIKKNPTSIEELVQAGIDAAQKQIDTPVLERFLKPAVIAAIIAMNTDLPHLRDLRNTAEVLKITAVSDSDAAQLKLFSRISHNLQSLNFLIDDGDLPTSARVFFGMTASSEVLPDMKTENKLIDVALLVASGTAAMVVEGLTPPSDFNAASIALLLTDFQTKRAAKVSKTTIFNTSEINLSAEQVSNITLMFGFGEDCEYNFKGLTAPEMRTACKGWGMKYVTKKDVTQIDISAKYSGIGMKAVGINFRIGQIDTKKNKVKLIPATLGAKGTTNAHAELSLYTAQEGDLYLIAESPLIATKNTPIKIVPGTDQSLTITLDLLPPEV